MAAFRYEAYDAAGRLSKGVLEADTARQLRARLREQGLLVAAVEALSESAQASGGRHLHWRRRLSGAQLSLITRQFATLLAAGLPVEQTLNALIEQADTDYQRQVLAGVRGEVLAGHTLARSLQKFPRVFPELYVTLVAAGEQSGRLGEVMERLADYTESHQALRQKVGLAFIYPAIVTLVAGTVVLGLLTYVVPQVVNVFQNTNQTLPWLTRALIGVSDFLRASWWLWLAVIAVAVWLARRRVSGMARLAQVPLGLLVYGVVSFLLLRAAVPEESLFDLVGSPVLDWPRSLELGMRWVALAAVPGTVLYLAAQTVRRWRGRRLGALHYWAAALPLALAYWGVVAQAATDNLTELIATPRPLSFAALCAGFYIISLAAALLASPAIAAHRSARWGAVALSLPLAASCFYLGLAGEIDKYGQQFSALQFLLSSDRMHYVSLPFIWLRYAALHAIVVAVLALLQWPHFRAAQRHSAHAHL